MSSSHATIMVAHADQVVHSLPVTRVDHVRSHVKVLNTVNEATVDMARDLTFVGNSTTVSILSLQYLL